MKPFLSALSSSTRWLLEFSLVRIFSTPMYIVLGFIIGIPFAFYSADLQPASPCLWGLLGLFFPFAVLAVGRHIVEAIYVGRALECGVNGLKGKPVVLYRAYVRLAAGKLKKYADNLALLTTEDGCQFKNGITLEEQLAVIEASIECAFGSSTQNVNIYHIWNDEIFPIDEFWKEESVKEYLNDLPKAYNKDNARPYVVRLFVVDEGRRNALKQDSAFWNELKAYHHQRKILGYYCTPAAFNAKKKPLNIDYVDATLVESKKRTFALVVKESGGSKFVKFLLSKKELLGLRELFRRAEDAADMFSD